MTKMVNAVTVYLNRQTLVAQFKLV